jgi:tetratricopeptide (TPR) repeat protein
LDGQAATRLLRAVLHLQSGNATLAIDQLAPVLAEQPLNLRVRLLLARAYYQDGQYAQAERTLFPIVERADADSYALTLAARIQEALGQRAIAGKYLTRANAPMRGAADVFRGAGSPTEVAGDALAQPAQAAPNLRYIRALLEAGQVQTALARANMLRAANPGAPAAHIVLGDCLSAAGRFAEAARAYEQAGNLRFDDNSALRIVAAWQNAGQPAKAQRALALFLAQNPAQIDANRLAATLWLATGDFDRAIPILEGLQARLGNEDALLMSDLARAWLGKGDTERALGYAAHAYRLQPGSAVTSDIFGWTLFRSGGKNDVALDLLKKAAQLSPREPLVQRHLQQVYGAMGRRTEAPKG